MPGRCVERMPYSDATEKPPLFREATFQKAWKSVDVNLPEEVRALPDFVVPEKTGSNVLKRLSERKQDRHYEAVNSMDHELGCIAREMEPFFLESGKFLLTELMESDRKIELQFKKIECDTALEGFSVEGLEELWNIIHQECLTRRKWIKKIIESFKNAEKNRANKITDVLRKYTLILEQISFFLEADVHRFMNDKAMTINKQLLTNRRTIAKLFHNLMKSEVNREFLHHLKWQKRVEDWKLIQKNCVVQSFREFMANEEIQNPPTVKREMENMIMDQIVLSGKRLEFLQHLGDLFPPTHTKAEINEWYGSFMELNRSIDTHNVECMMKMRVQYEMVQQKCLAEVQLCKNKLLNLNVCTEKEAEETVNSDFLSLTDKLKSWFEELECMDRDFQELAKHNEQNFRDLYSYFWEVINLWDVHQLKLSQQQDELQKKLDDCRWNQDKLIQVKETNLHIILNKMRTASSEEKLKKHLEKALSCLDGIRDRYEAFNQVLMDEVMAYPETVLQELISYSISISQYFNVKEIFKQNLQGKVDSMFQEKVDSTFQDQELVKASEAEHLVEQQAESIVQDDEGEEKTNSCQQENEERSTTESEEAFAQETEEAEEKEDGESMPHESGEIEHAEQGVNFTQAMFNNSKAESSEIATETFSTSSGNSYTVLGVEEAEKTDIPETYFTKYERKESLPMYLRNVLIKETVFVELKKRIRLCIFEHLEKWFAECLSNSGAFVAAKQEELYSKLQLRLHLHQQRQEDIKTNIYDLRAAELLLHRERLECHCAAVVEAVEKEKAGFLKFRDYQNNIIKNLHSRICDMESTFLNAPMTQKLVSSSNNLLPELHNHVEMIHVSLKSYQKYLEEALGKLRNSNVDFLKACRLFLEGGNFSPEEAVYFSKRLQEESKRIDSFESSIKTDMEKMKSSCLNQATKLINHSETKLRYLFMNRVFLEKIQRFLRNLRVQIKSEVGKSNLQAATLNSDLETLQQKIDACAHPTVNKEALTSEELYGFAKVVLQELKKRSQYLDCLLLKTVSPHDNEDFTPLVRDGLLQGPIAVTIRRTGVRAVNEVLVTGLDPVKYPLLVPSSMEKPAVDDLAIGVIKNLLEINPSRKSSGLNEERNDHSDSLGPDKAAQIHPKSKKKDSHLKVPDKGPQNSATQRNTARTTKKSSSKKRMPRRRWQKCTTSVLSDQRFQIFGEKPPQSDTFKGMIMNILWTGNNNLLCLAEEFYQKEKTEIIMREDLPETFEHYAEMLKQNLLSLQRQTDDYYNSCLKEFQDQLKLFEKQLPYVSQLAVDGLFKEHEQELSYSTGQIRHIFDKKLQDWENMRVVHQNQLHPSLGHPDNLLQLDGLYQDEIKRQKDQADGIRLNTQMLQVIRWWLEYSREALLDPFMCNFYSLLSCLQLLQNVKDCVAECAQNFVSALAAFTENLLLELDESITIDDVQVAKTEIPREETSTLIHRKEAALPLEIHEVKQLIERGSRTWPGIPMTTIADNSDYILCKETASVRTAKTTLGHIAAVEARDAAYKKYKCKLEQQFAQIKEESTAQLLRVQRWQNWWKRSVQKIKELYK